MNELDQNTIIENSDSKREFDEYWKQCGNVNDPTLLILRVHLYCEYLMDRMFIACVKRPDRLLRDARLSFYQKTKLIHSFDILPDNLIDALDGLNSVRNGFAHDLNKSISMSDVDRIGHSLSKSLIQLKKEYNNDVAKVLDTLLMKICHGLAFQANKLESIITKASKNE
jgi:hypothetical protein